MWERGIDLVVSGLHSVTCGSGDMIASEMRRSDLRVWEERAEAFHKVPVLVEVDLVEEEQ
jgi:hypothetical protein